MSRPARTSSLARFCHMPRGNASWKKRPPARATITSVRPRKALGQHFLHDTEVLDRIVREGGFGPDDQVIEVGGGTGELTERLARVAGRLISVELDETLCRLLRARMEPFANTAVICTNILDHTPSAILAEGGGRMPFAVAGNVPYYITNPIFRKFLASGERPSRLVLLVQREVAESVTADPGKLSLLGVSVQVFGAARILFNVSAKAFLPPPKVESAVVRVDVYPEPLVPAAEEEQFFKVVRAGFRNPRKQLHNAIASGLWLPPDRAPDLLTAAGIDGMRRAQTLSIDEWLTLTRTYAAFKRDLDAGRAAQ